MKALFPLIASIASLAASPYGVSIAPGTQQELPEGATAVRFSPASSDFAASPKAGEIRRYGVLRPEAIPADDKAWSDFVTESLENKITSWEVLDSFNLGPRQQNSPFRYVELLTLAKKAAPQARIGFSLANYDLEFLDDALRDGAGGQFDFISLSPFPCSEGSAPVLATVLPTIRKLLASHKADPAIPVHITLTGSETALAEAAPLALSLGFAEIFLATDPATIAKIPSAPIPAPAPPDLAGKESVRVTLGETNTSEGLYQVLPSDTPWDAKLGANRLQLTASPPAFRTSFLTAPGFISPEDSEIEITVTAKRIPSEGGQENPSALSLTYESTYGTNSPKVWFSVDGGNKWHTHTWTIKDAKFTGKLGWNFLLDASGAGNDILIRDVSVKR